MHVTCNLTMLFIAFYGVGVIEFAYLCERAPIAPEDDVLKDHRN